MWFSLDDSDRLIQRGFLWMNGERCCAERSFLDLSCKCLSYGAVVLHRYNRDDEKWACQVSSEYHRKISYVASMD